MKSYIITKGAFGYLVVVVVLAAVLVIPASAEEAKPEACQPPTIETILEAFKHQNTATIEVKYNIIEDWVPEEEAAEDDAVDDGQQTNSNQPNQTKHPPRPVDPPQTYIRTPEMLYIKLPIGPSGVYEARSSERNGIDGVANIQLKAADASGFSRGTSSTENAIAFWGSYRGGRMETILFPLDKRGDDQSSYFLYGWIKYAQILDKPEQIDGHKCWKLEATGTDDSNIKRLEIWLDPKIGFNPRRIKESGGLEGDEGWSRVIDSLDYKEIAEGIWFPKKQILTMNWPKGRIVNNRRLLEVVELHGDKKFTKDELKLTYDSELPKPKSP